ncbi:MAG: sulfotransferase domain-containing protein [Wenzhouxiangellaceae bacterium]
MNATEPGRAPDFLIIGAQKCGTSWLHHQLRQSDEIFMPDDKDHEHFSYVGNLNAEAFADWCRRFAAAPAGQLIGDANAAYFWTRSGSAWSRQPDSFNPDIPRSVQQFCGSQLKLIVMLRDPVERSVSAYLHHIRHGAITPDDSILDTDLPLGIVDMSLFRVHLANWLDVYPAENIHIVKALPDSRESAVTTVETVCRFLGAAPPPLERYYFEPVFPGLPRVVDESGVWLRAAGEDQPALASRPDAEKIIDGERYLRVVSAEELARLRELFAGQAIV